MSNWTRFAPAVALLALTCGASAQDMAMGSEADHLMVSPEAFKWVDGPASLPKGVQMMAITGDPTKEGIFTMRLKIPAGARVAPHWHPADEHITVIQGTFFMGTGETFDTAKMRPLNAGSFAHMKPGTRHYAMAGNTETIVQLHGVGPWRINYVNPADDPRAVK